MLVHISNRFLDLEPVVSSAAAAGAWHGARLLYFPAPGGPPGGTPSLWSALSHDTGKIAALRARNAAWTPLPRYPGFTPWSDDYSTILPLIKALH